jgi:uncharacterized YccA/Bax inhibitor family protein
MNTTNYNRETTIAANPQPPYSTQDYPPQPGYIAQQPDGNSHGHMMAHGVAQTFGLHPAMALLTVVVNTMVFVSGLVSGGTGWLISIPVGVVIAIITYKGQKKWFADDHESALIKALIVGFLTAIPTSLPGYLTLPAGVLGFFRRK